MKDAHVVRLRRSGRTGPRIIASAAAAALTALAMLAPSTGLAQVDGEHGRYRELACLRRLARAAGGGSEVLRRGAGRQDGKPVVKQAKGLANRKRKRANSIDTKFNIGSVGKTFTAVAIAQLVEEGKLSFGDSIGKYVSGFPHEVADKITIGQLLTHTSGLGDVFPGWHPAAPSPLDVSELMKRIVKQPLQFEPGSRFGYSNSGFVVLGAIVEAVTGQDYYDYVREHVFKPAGMAHTGWYTLDQVPNMAHGYMQVDKNGRWVPPGRQPPPGAGPTPGKPVAWRDGRGAGGAGNPAGGAYSTVGDLFRFAQALLKNKLLSRQMTNTVLAGRVDTRRPGAPQVSKHGYGFEDEILNGVPIVGYGGGAPGIEAQLRMYPDLRYTVVILTNQDGAVMPSTSGQTSC